MSWYDIFKMCISLLGYSGIVLAIMFGLASWLGKVWAGRILQNEKVRYENDMEKLKQKFAIELEKIKAEHGKKHTVHKLQFEKEFEIYKELWKALVEVRGSAVISPSLDVIPEGKDLAEVYKDRMNKAWDNINKLHEIILSNQPFYHTSIRDASKDLIWDCRQHTKDIVKALQGRQSKTINIHDKADELQEKLNKTVDEIEKVIQNRIGLLQEAELVG